MIINLSEIPEEGRSYVWNNQTGELNSALKDLIGKKTYHAEFTIRPLNTKDFELSGSIKTGLPEQCSRCGIDFEFPVSEKFREILIPHQDQPRNSKYSKVNHLSDAPSDGPETLEYHGHSFDIGEYVHEVIALAAPFNPAGPENEDGDCSICEIPVKGRSFSYNEEMPEEKPESPFAALKNIKIN
jgi:Predicted metal-binding, possibly nucleic acid-binding protein